MKQWGVAAIAVALVLALLAASVWLRRNGVSSGAGNATVPGGGLDRSAAGDPVQRGRAAYFKHCVACHSPDTDEYVAGIALKGYFSNPPTTLADGTLFPRTDEAIRELLEKGTRNMPPLRHGMTEQEVEDILAYLHTL